MAALYLHIPFCRRACHYCNFHFSTSLRLREEMVEALCAELALRKEECVAPLQSIYFGGGTPSLLHIGDLEQLFDAIMAHYAIDAQVEVTLEANPEDLTEAKLRQLRRLPVNRLSIGVQSFRDEDLQFLNRNHDGASAKTAILRAQAAGFDNITIDLIYGTPTLTDAAWAQNVECTLDLEVPHISAYCLTVEPRTALAHFVRQGRVPPVNDDVAARQFLWLIDQLSDAGMVHYEISNFGYEGYWSRHNTSYWLGVPYVGIGPSAHSYDGQLRCWNEAHNMRYVRALQKGQLLRKCEVLSAADRYNEYVMVRLRTVWGCRLADIEAMGAHWAAHFLKEVAPFVQCQWVEVSQGVYRLTRQGKLYADRVASELFFAE